LLISQSTHLDFSARRDPATTVKRLLAMPAAHCGSSLPGPHSHLSS